MSFSINDAKLERQRDLSQTDPVRLFALAQIIKAEGNDELAEELYNRAKQYEAKSMR